MFISELDWPMANYASWSGLPIVSNAFLSFFLLLLLSFGWNLKTIIFEEKKEKYAQRNVLLFRDGICFSSTSRIVIW